MANVRFILQRFVQVHGRFLSGSGYAMSKRHCPPSLSSLNGMVSGPSLYELVCGARSISSSGILSHIMVQMPALSPTMDQGNIAKWRKKEGDKIDVGDVICEIETDKATLEFESLEEGYLAKILTPEGSKDVRVGTPIAITVYGSYKIDFDASVFISFYSNSSVFFVLPWQLLLKVEDPEEMKDISVDTLGLDELKEKQSVQHVEPTEHKHKYHKKGIVRISPSAKRLIAEHGIDASSLEASGPRGTLLKGDVLAAIKFSRGSPEASFSSERKASTHIPPVQQKATGSSPFATTEDDTDAYEDLPNSLIRKVIAKRLLESKQRIPHFYLSSDVRLDPLLSFRNELKEQHNLKVSVNDIVIKAVALALSSVPEANACWSDEKEMAILSSSIDISIAVATEKGLMTPIIRNADQKTLSAISAEVKELAEKARNGKLKPEQFQGGTFSISNLGMFPVDRFCAIINPPQACILAVGRGNQLVEPVIGSDGLEKPEVVTKMSLNLSADHHVIDAEIGGKFLEALCSNLRDLRRLFL